MWEQEPACRRCLKPSIAGAGVLAAELGTVSETFSRTLAEFRRQNLLEVKGKTLTVLNPKKLSELLRKNLGE